MFPQSELDNYKLQVELLQEKLQRSEISRKQLEHKLEKLLQKRDEYEKIARSKAKQKYQQFLEEQQRRNERNKQLVQMLERIEQQTEIMNARSERLKMMKLQYEMYFARLVHSQTKRCIQNSVTPVVPQMKVTTSVQPQAQNVIFGGIEQPIVMEDYKYMHNINTPMTYQDYATIPNYEKDQYISRQQFMNMHNETTEMPTLTNLEQQDRSVKMALNNIEGVPAGQYESYSRINETNIENLTNDKPNKNDMELSYLTKTKLNTNINYEPAPIHLLIKDKELANSPKLARRTSSTFEQVPNVNMMSQMQINNNSKKYQQNISPLSTTYLAEASLNNESNLQPVQRSSNSINPMQKSMINNTDNTNQITEDIESSASCIDKTLNEIQVENKTPSKIVEIPLVSSSEISEIIAPKSAISTNNIKPETNKTQNLPNVPLNNNSSSATPVSIENIENAIYGELLSPLVTEQEQKKETVSVVPKLLDNLVTQPETIRTENQHNIEANAESKLDTNLINNGNEQVNEVKKDSNNENIAYEEYNNTQQNEPLINNVVDYQSYENNDSNTVDDNQQEQQQYDYSNYDPTQYSYPGYIYDETTGEYKPDPNAPAEQYATDQQYAAEVYDQQYELQNAYDYDQTYSQEQPKSNLDDNAYNNYDPALQENTSNITNIDINTSQQHDSQQTQQSDSEAQQALEHNTEDIKQLSTKITKPTSILSTTDKNESQKKKKRVNFVDSSEADESVTDKEVASKPKAAITGGSSESDFDFSSSTEGETKTT